LDLQRQIAGQNREFSQLAEANGRSRAERDSQLEGLRGAIDKVAKKQRHEGGKVSGLQEAMGEVRRQIEGVTIKLSETEEAVERRVGPLEWVALGLAETKDRTSRFESEVTGLRAAITDGSAEVEEVRRQVAGLKAQFSDDCPKVKRDLTSLEQELVKLKEEIKTMRPRPQPYSPPAAWQSVGWAQKSSVSAPLPPSGPLRIKGLIQCLAERCGGRLLELGVVAVTASSNVDSAKNVVDLQSNSCYVSAARPSSWICINFKNTWITPSRYSIVNCGDGGAHLKSWVIEASKGGEDWVVLDRRENCDDMKEANAVGTFSMFRSDRVRLIRLRQIGPVHSGQSFFGLAGFEVYGSLLSPHFEEERLIARQTQECSKNVHDARLVVCSARGNCDEWPAKNAADPGRESVFFSEDKPDQWICYNFGRRLTVGTRRSG
jgi:predicted  nucleic acid-binding Zn-ribbon protein